MADNMLYLASINAYINEDAEGNLFINGENVVDISDEFMATISKADVQAVWDNFKYDLHGNPDFDFSQQ